MLVGHHGRGVPDGTRVVLRWLASNSGRWSRRKNKDGSDAVRGRPSLVKDGKFDSQQPRMERGMREGGSKTLKARKGASTEVGPGGERANQIVSRRRALYKGNDTRSRKA